MAWQDTLIPSLRYWINDLDPSDYTWSDDQLQLFLLISARKVVGDLIQWESSILGPYVITLIPPSFTPDPIANGAPMGFIDLIIIQAACIIARGEHKKLGVTAGWKISDDRSTIDGTKALDTSKNIVENFCGLYMTSIEGFKAGTFEIGSAILSPYSSDNGPHRFDGYGRI